MNRIPEEQAFWQSTLDLLRDNFGSTGFTVAEITLAILALTIVAMVCGRRATLSKAVALFNR
jgi:hypothetical protein